CGIPFAETLGAAEIAFVDTQATDPPLCFPDLNGREDQRMEDLVASRLFPNRSSAERIGRYMLLDRLGQGGMGVVYSAYDAELERKVAIKLLRPGQLTRNAEPRLRREAQAMAKVVHANVVSVIEVGTHDEVTYVVMEHIRGHSLAQWCQKERSWRETLGVFVQAGRGLAAAHRAGVIHRDFKMHNAMIIREGPDAGRVKVLDFGLARAVDNEEPTPADARLVSDELANRFAVRLTASGAVMGTPAYMAPEQITRGHASERSDQYNFAASLYEALYGELPFTGTSPGALIRAVLDDPLPPPRPNADVPGWVYRIVAQGLARDPADRFPGMDVLCDALERDPSAKRRNLAFALGAILLVGAGSWSLGTLSSESPCTGPDFELTETWDLARAQAVQHAFGAAGVTYADDAASRAIGLLDDYAEHWSEARGEACEAHRRGVESQQLLDLRMACLGRRRASFASLAELLVDADAQVVERAVEAAHNLPPIVMCRGETLLSAIALPEDRTIAKQVNEAREQLAATVAIANAGRHDRAHEQLDALRARTESLGFLPLTAEIELARGTVALEQRRASSAEHALTTALDAALEAGA
ncbi:MAG: serine/threonine-protein kinase, partial [Nannocystaceae bacterium]